MSGMTTTIHTTDSLLDLRHVGLHLFSLRSWCWSDAMELSHANVTELGEGALYLADLAERMNESGRRVQINIGLDSIPAKFNLYPAGKKGWNSTLGFFTNHDIHAGYLRGVNLGGVKDLRGFSDAFLVLASEVAR